MKKIILTILFSFSLVLGQKVWWVDMYNGNDSNDGTTAAKAFKTIHKVLESNSYLTSGQVDTVKVMPSVNSDNPNGYYDFKNDELYTYNSRDFVLIGLAGADSTIFDAQSTNRHMTIDDGQSNKTKFIDITFRNGFAQSWPGAGAIFLSNGSDVQFINCIFKNNKTDYNEGGGAIIARDGSTPSFTSCTFDNNRVEVTSTGSSGGAVVIQWPSSKEQLNEAIVFRNSKFINNYVKADYSAFGGAIKSERSIKIENCLFVNNYVLSNEDGTYNNTGGGAVYTNAVWWNSSSQRYEGGTMTIANSTFHGNYVSSKTKDQIGGYNLYGGTIAYGDYYGESNSKSYIFNSTITGSRVLAGGEKFVYSNTDNEKRAIVGAGYPGGYKLSMDYSNVQAPRQGSGWGDYIYNVNPSFKDPANGDYSLSDKSPLIGAGVATWDDEDISAPTSDINAKYDQAFNVVTTSVRPNPAASNPDIGAYENSLAASNAPMPVSDLVVTAASSGVKMGWSKVKESLNSSTDASDIEYQIYQDGTNVAQTSNNSISITGLTNGTSYSFSVSAKNTSTGIESAFSDSISIKPRYSGPWYVATSGGKALTEAETNYNYGSKDSPINHLSNAIEIAAAGDTIIMMKGTHSGSNNRSINPSDKKQFVITGELGYSADQTIIDASGRDRHFKFNQSGIDSNFVIQNITLYNGEIEGSSEGGGSIIVSQGSPKFHKVIFKANVDSTTYWRGAGAILVSDQGSVIIDSCIFDGNRKSMYSSNSTENENYNNYAQGGALSFDNSQSRSAVRGSTFKNNKAYGRYDARGSAIYMNYAAVDIVNSLFYNNEARSAIGSTNGASATGVITYNSGPMVYVSNNWQPTTSLLVNNTIVNNLSSSARTNSWLVSGVYYCSYDFGDNKNPEVFAFNNIIYGNKNLNGSEWVTEEYQLQLHCGEPIFRNDYNLIYNLENLKNGPGGSSNYFNFDYSLDVDPGFKDSTLGDFNLSDASLAIGAGIANWSDWDKKAPLSDILGGDRPNPSGSNPDLGAYENALGVSPYPSQVKNVTAFGGSGEITLTWSAVSGTGIKYRVYKHTSAFNPTDDPTSGIENKYYVGEATETTYTLAGLDNTTRYYLRVTAVNEAGFEGTASSTIDITPKFSGPVYWLATDGLDTNEGSSAKPFKSLEHAIGVISTGDTLMIKEGTYTGSKNRRLEISQTSTGNYDKFKNVVITSEKGPENTIFDAGGIDQFLMIRGSIAGPIDSTLQIIGLTFQNGRSDPNNSSGYAGGAIHLQSDIENSGSGGVVAKNQPKFKNCVFKNNETINQWGGAIYVQGAAPIFENCVFENNRSSWGGGAIFAYRGNFIDYDTLFIRSSTFKNNVVDNSNSQNDGQVSGGAIFTSGHSPTFISSSTFENNKALSYGNGGGSFGGALYIEGSWDEDHRNGVYIVNSRFSKNVADWFGDGNTNTHGGAIYASGPFTMFNTVLDSNIANLSGNSSNGRGMGGALHIQIQSSNNGTKGQSILVNNTIVNNIASTNNGMGEGAGIYLNNPGDQNGIWFNNVIYGNRNTNNSNNSNNSNNANSFDPSFFGALTVGGSPEDFNIVNGYNNIEGALDQQMYSFGNNTFDVNPGFVSPSNYGLSDASPMIGLGVASFDGVSAPSDDYLGNKRPNPVGSMPDLGAYENALSTSPYPAQVQNLTGTPNSGQVALSWDALEATNIEHYEVYMSTSPNIETKTENYVDQSTTTSLLVTGLQNNTEYYFKVAAVDSDGYLGSFSKELQIIPSYSGPNWWISNNGSDGIGDGSKENPFKSLIWPLRHIKGDGSSGDEFAFFNDGDTIRLMASNQPYDMNGTRFTAAIIEEGDQYSYIEVDGMFYNAKLTNFTIMGDSNDPRDVSIDGSNLGHFMLDGVKATFKNITLQNSWSDDNGASGGSITSRRSEINIENTIFDNNYTANRGGAINLLMSSGSIKNTLFLNNTSSNAGGAMNIDNDNGDGPINVKIEITNSVFEGNRVTGSQESGNSWGGAINVWPNEGLDLSISKSLFKENEVYGNSDGAGASGAAINIVYRDYPGLNYDNVDPIQIEQNIFNENKSEVMNDSQWTGPAVYIGWPTHLTNSLFDANYVQNNSSGGGGSSAVGFSFGEDVAGEPYNVFANNTVVNNFFSNASSGTNDHSPVYFYQANAIVINNIVWDNPKGYIGFNSTDDVKFNNHNNFDKWDQNNSIFGSQTFSHDPKFKNSNNNNFQLSSNSLLIDAGMQEVEGFYTAPVTDLRGYFRVGSPDIGAYEVGGSKYLLAFEDDIIDGEVIELDDGSTVPKVKFEDEITFTVQTNDRNGDLISSNEQTSWNVFPNQKYVTFLSGDQNTEGGDASATFKITDQEQGKGFRFRIEVAVGEASIRSQTYVIEDIALGSPPPVLDLTITPSDWSSDPNFTLEWSTPVWSENRELIGAVAEVTDGVNDYDQFLQFPTGDTLTSFNFSLPEAGEFHTEVWLMDEYGNEDQDSARSAKAYFDNIPPDDFLLHWPESSDENISYVSDRPRFIWEERGDYPSGIKEWRLFINNNLYGTYTGNDVTFENGDVYVDAETALEDGYYDWWMEAIDMAGNATYSSDTAYFGVDLSPPDINHPSPLITIDENTTSPSVNASFFDAASGVNFGRLHYRRAGSNGGFVTVDLTAGPVNIPGSDIKKDGLEYFIDSEDNIGNYGYWPEDKAFQSVRVRSEASISTASQWASGVPGQGTDSTNYWFFSIPFDVGNAKNIITSVMGQSDEFNYRLYGYNNGWQENPGSVTMGNGYFFIYDPSKYEDILPIKFDFGQGVSTLTDPPFKISVSPGSWKFIGTPYNFNVPLSNIYTEEGNSLNDAGSIYSWNGSWSSAGSNMQPWKGYIFKSGGATELNIDARGIDFGKMAKSLANADDIPMDSDEWVIDMMATSGESRDEMNAVGVRHMAKDGYDRLDEFEPPVVPGNLTLRIDNREREISPDLYAKDIRKPNKEGHYWDLQVYAPTNGLRTYLTFEGLGYIPQEYDVFLINKTTKQAKNLEWESTYRFANTGPENYLKQEFRLVVGTKKFVENNNAGVNLYPDAFTLAQNYPNPFNPQTSIMISLEQDAQVDLIIYNLLGEEITRLAANERRPAGYYNFIWNGRNQLGAKVSTGVYFYHALIRNEQGKVVLNKTRKMIFLK